MAKVKVSFVVDEDKLPDIEKALRGKAALFIQSVKNKPDPTPRPQPVLTVIPGNDNPVTRKRMVARPIHPVLEWRSAGALLKVFNTVPIAREPDFRHALQTANFAPGSWSSLVWRLVQEGVLTKTAPGAYRLTEEFIELRSRASE